MLHAKGVNFSSGASFAINMNQLQLDEELGKGNYGTVQKVYHKPTNVAMAMKVRKCFLSPRRYEHFVRKSVWSLMMQN